MLLKTTTILAALVASTKACIHFRGSTTYGLGTLAPNLWTYEYSIEDNGIKVCDGIAGYGGDRWLAHCIEGKVTWAILC